MKRRKKIIALGIIFAISLTSVTACGGDPVPTTVATTEATTIASTTAALLNQTKAEDVTQIEGYTLLWNDRFNGDTLNEAIWTRETREPGWTNNELQGTRIQWRTLS